MRYPYIILVLLLLVSNSVGAQKPVTGSYAPGTSVNYIRTWTPVAPATDASALPVKGLTEVKEATQYFDGLGRPLQTVVKKGSMVTTDVNNVAIDAAGAKDQVTPVLYDAFGREQYRFSPYASTSSDGLLKTDPFSELLGANTAKYGSQGEDNYYSQTVFEASPLNRVMEQFAPGKNWAGTATQSVHRSIKTDYWVNTATDAVRIWAVNHAAPAVPVASDYAASGVYPAGELYKNVTEDEHGKQVIEFKDKDGQVILKKVQLTAGKDDGTGSGHDGWICTYYIYDDLNRLRCVIQPEGVKALAGNGWQLTTNLLAEQCFRYEYDDRSRMVVKKVPGAAEVVMVYDVRDRLVMTQDGNQREAGLWLYTQYDHLNRPVKTGLLSANNTPATHWNAAKSKSGDTNADIQYPEAGTLQYTTALTETFYDDYTWVNKPEYNIYDAEGFKAFDMLHNGHLLGASNTTFPYAQAPAKDGRTRGLVTGTRTNVLGTYTYITTLMLYDNKARPVQVKSINYTGGIDITTTQYSWSGQPLVVVSKQEKQGNNALALTTVTKNSYDALGRLVKTTKNVSSTTGINSGEKVIAVNKYDELGQLAGKTLGAADVNGTAGAETQAYDYNVRGWLLGMNRGYVNSASAATTNFFGFDLAYDKTNNNRVSESNGAVNSYTTAFYNGNIAGMSWRGQGSGSTGEIRRYDFSYDNANRLMKADFKQYAGSGFDANGNFASQMGDGNPGNPGSAYDLNGNIQSMIQQGLYLGAKTTIDQLTYTYNPGSNKLLKVKDDQTTQYNLGDFHDGSSANNNDYTYDINGNLKSDLNKNISTISYNMLNLPELIYVDGKGGIAYLYDAAGNKLSKTVYDAVAGQKITTYLGGMVFENDVLQHVSMEEGRFRPNGTAFTADYFLKDHLGNVRSMINENRTLLEETHYYPFGLAMKGISTSASGNVHNKEKTFQDQQIDEDLDLNWVQFKYRNHDPQIGRFIEIDPLSDKYTHNSTYAFSENKVVRHVELEGLESAPFEYMNGRRLTESEKAIANRIKVGTQNVLEGTILAVFSLPNAIGENHYANNATDPVKKREHLQAADYWGKEALINYATGFLMGKLIGGIKAGFVNGENPFKGLIGINKLGAKGEELTKKVLEKEFKGAEILEQVRIDMDGAYTIADFVITEKGKITGIFESKVGGNDLSNGQKLLYNDKEVGVLTGKNAGQYKGVSVDPSKLKTGIYRWDSNTAKYILSN